MKPTTCACLPAKCKPTNTFELTIGHGDTEAQRITMKRLRVSVTLWLPKPCLGLFPGQLPAAAAAGIWAICPEASTLCR